MRRVAIPWILALAFLVPAGCATVGRRTAHAVESTEVGTASYYARRFHGRATASGKAYDETELSAAHRTLPFGTRVRVTNLRNDRSVVVTITDRGPHHRKRVIDLSRRAARVLDFLQAGTARVRLEILADEDSLRTARDASGDEGP